jgi:hypothetical protein
MSCSSQRSSHIDVEIVRIELDESRDKEVELKEKY